MLIHPWDAAISESEWREWLAATDRFGVLAVASRDGAAPFVVPTHFTMQGNRILMHLARPNPVWPHLEAAAEVRLAVIGDYAYVPSTWRAKAGDVLENGVPTSYYATVQFVCHPTVVDDPEAKVDILRAQFADQQPQGGHAEVSVDSEPYGPMLSGIRGLYLDIVQVQAKFKYDDQKPHAHREHVAAHLDQRGTGLDRAAARQQRRRLGAIGEWKQKRSQN
jgi:transcriptional regulator